jgi:hypothetical protein
MRHSLSALLLLPFVVLADAPGPNIIVLLAERLQAMWAEVNGKR